MSEYSSDNPPNCPQCQNNKNVKRNFAIDMGRSIVSIPHTLGMLAEKNTKNMSKDAKEAQWKKDHDYLFTEPKPLPPGMKRIGKPYHRTNETNT